MKLGIAEILQIIFVLAKIFNLINWSWWVVFLPLEITLGVIILNAILENID